MNGSKAAETLPIQLANWRSFYQSEFGIALGNVEIREAFTSSERLIVVAQSLTVDEVLSHCEKYFPIAYLLVWAPSCMETRGEVSIAEAGRLLPARAHLYLACE